MYYNRSMLQDIYYIVATIFMILSVVLLAGIGIGIFMVVKKINAIQREIKNKVELVSELSNIPTLVIKGVGEFIANAFQRFRAPTVEK